MNKEVSLERILFDVIMFFDRNKKLIISMTLVAIIGVFLFQKLKPSFYATTAIATSGISEYEGIKISEDDDVRNQRMAISLINDLQLDVDKEDFVALKSKLNLSIEAASQIKFIEAEPLLRQDKDEKFHNTSDFQINLVVRNANVIEDIEESLEFYFNEEFLVISSLDTVYNEYNKYIIGYWDEFKRGYKNRIDDIEKEMLSLETDSSHTKISNYLANEEIIANEIASLSELKTELERDLSLLKPLSFSKPFTQTTVAEREVLIWGSAIGFLAFILSIIVAIVREVKQKSLKDIG